MKASASSSWNFWKDKRLSSYRKRSIGARTVAESWDRSGGRTGCRPCEGNHPPGHQAGQYLSYGARAREDSGFRPGQNWDRNHAPAADGGSHFAGTTQEILTSPGTTVGTVAYMSPEQARGEELDARTDLFSFGAVLYEVGTGERAFAGNTSAVIFQAILDRAPMSPSRLNPQLDPKVDEIITKALEKDRKMRYQSASELRTDLARLKRDTESQPRERFGWKARIALVSEAQQSRAGSFWSRVRGVHCARGVVRLLTNARCSH